MCKESATAGDVCAAMPHSVAGSAADPIALEAVDDVEYGFSALVTVRRGAITTSVLFDTGLSPAAMAHPRRRAARQLGPGQQRHPLPAHR